MCGKGHNSLRRVQLCCAREKKKDEPPRPRVILEKPPNEQIELVELVSRNGTENIEYKRYNENLEQPLVMAPITLPTETVMPKIIAIAQPPK